MQNALYIGDLPKGAKWFLKGVNSGGRWTFQDTFLKTLILGGWFVDSLLPFVSGSCFYHAAVFFPDLLSKFSPVRQTHVERGRISFAPR